jgi:hypothetical protein
MTTDFQAVLRQLVRRAGLNERSFVRDFSRKMNVDARTPASWLKESKDGEPPKMPSHEKQEQVVTYFQSKLSCRDLAVEHLSLAREEFEKTLSQLLDKKASKTAGLLPFPPDALRDGYIPYLCGTYRLYRHSFVKGQDVINCDIVSVKRASEDDTLQVDMYCLPAREAVMAKSSASMPKVTTKQLEHFEGKLWKFGHLFLAMMHYSNSEKNERRRVRQLQFPVLEIPVDVHYGLVTGFAAVVGEPVAARALAKKISDEDIARNECDAGRVRPIEPHDSEVEALLDLVNNQLVDDMRVLTVDHKKAFGL